MQEFDPRQTVAVRFTPPALAFLSVLTVTALGWQVAQHQVQAGPAGRLAVMDEATLQAVRQQAQARLRASAAAASPAPVNLMIKVAPGETFEAAVRRTGVGREEAREAVAMLGRAFDTVNIKAGMAFQAAVARPLGAQGSAKLVNLSMRVGPATAVTLSRAVDGGLHLNKLEEKVVDQTTVAAGRMGGSLFVSAQKAGATPELTAQVVKLFSHKLDFSRDIRPGDRFSMVFDRKVTASGHAVSAGELLFAEIQAKGGATRLYRFKSPGMTEAQYFDGLGKNIRGLLLRTPLDSVRITSSFGMREHPILGFTRMHAGIDFGAPQGTPVYAAGDGVVKRAEWAGGYGRWLQIQHAGGYETGYGHLSRWAVKAGQHVHQGQVVAYVGSTGLSTGPHLHYEIMVKGQKVNPSGFKAPSGTVLTGKALAAFKSEKARIDGLVAAKTGVVPSPVQEIAPEAPQTPVAARSAHLGHPRRVRTAAHAAHSSKIRRRLHRA
jgi:murein DD-endopeptidase MepM/ murein hydrolase activator NlpD